MIFHVWICILRQMQMIRGLKLTLDLDCRIQRIDFNQKKDLFWKEKQYPANFSFNSIKLQSFTIYKIPLTVDSSLLFLVASSFWLKYRPLLRFMGNKNLSFQKSCLFPLKQYSHQT